MYSVKHLCLIVWFNIMLWLYVWTLYDWLSHEMWLLVTMCTLPHRLCTCVLRVRLLCPYEVFKFRRVLRGFSHSARAMMIPSIVYYLVQLCHVCMNDFMFTYVIMFYAKLCHMIMYKHYFIFVLYPPTEPEAHYFPIYPFLPGFHRFRAIQFLLSWG